MPRLRLRLDDGARRTLEEEDEGGLDELRLSVGEALERCKLRGVNTRETLAKSELALQELKPIEREVPEELAERRRKLREEQYEREYEKATRDVRREAGASDKEVPRAREAVGFGLHVVTIMATLAAVGWEGGARVMPDNPDVGRLAGVISGITAGMIAEGALFAIRASSGIYRN